MSYLLRSKGIKVVLAVMALAIALAASACGGTASKSCGTECQRGKAVHLRTNAFDRANAEVPAPQINTFPERKLLVDLTVRQSQEHHPWYVYQFGQNGNVVRYFVAKQFPVNNCDYISTTENINYSDSGNVVTRLPSLLGIYQDGSCTTYVFEDAVTDAIETAPIDDVIVSDKPLSLHAGALKVQVVK